MKIPNKFNRLGIDRNQQPLRLTATQDGSSVKLTKTGSPTVEGLKYRLKNSYAWTSYTIDTVINLDSGDHVEFMNINSTISTSASDYVQFVMAGTITASGNIQSLLNYIKNVPLYSFYSLFKGCSSLTSAPELPATTLAASCYKSMFSSCSSLTEAPELPATTLADYCYQYMFAGCTSLTEAPELPAILLKTACYSYMFSVCRSLTTMPNLVATTLAPYCYEGMFNICTSLVTASELPATTLANNCYNSMFQGCTSLIEAPFLPALHLINSCYYGMFNGCTSLIAGPVINATTLESDTCSSMFNGCSSLTSITVKFNSWAENATTNWMGGVSASGTFTKPGGLPEVRGASAIPNTWTISNTYKRNLAYLESTETQYIDTGITQTNSNFSIEWKVDTTDIAADKTMFGAQYQDPDGTSSDWIWAGQLYCSTKEKYTLLLGKSFQMNISIEDGVHECNLSLINGTATLTVDSVQKAQLTNVQYPAQIYSTTLFANNFNGRPQQRAQMKLYGWKYYENNVLVHDFIPVMNNDDVPCLYDKVTATFKYNAGTGSFNYGELPYKYKLNYLEGTGTQYIDTGVTNEDATLEITSYGVHGSGCRVGYANSEYRMTISSNRADSAFGSSINQYDQTNIGSYKHVFKLANDGGFYIDDVLIHQHESSISNYLNIYIFAFNNNGTATFAGNYTSRIYDVKIDKNGVLNNHYIPVIDSNGVPAMYDELNGAFKYNSGSGDFNYA